MFKFLKKKDPIEDLWQWFEKNRTSYEEMDDERIGENLDPLFQRVTGISSGLAVEMSRRDAEGVRDLVISANGDRNLFPIVTEIVENAPKFEHWTVTAFRPRIAGASVLKGDDGLEFDSEKMFFAAGEIEGDLDVFIYMENISGKDERQVFGLGMILIEHLLGEYDCAMKVRAFGFHDLNDAPEDWPLSPLMELPEIVDDFHMRYNN